MASVTSRVVVLAVLLLSVAVGYRIVTITRTSCPLDARWDPSRDQFFVGSMAPDTTTILQRIPIQILNSKQRSVAATTVITASTLADPHESAGVFPVNGDFFVVKSRIERARTPAGSRTDQMDLYKNVSNQYVLDNSVSLASYVPSYNSVFGSAFIHVAGSDDGTTQFVSDSYEGQIIKIVNGVSSRLIQDTRLGGPDPGTPNRPPLGVAGMLYFENGGSPFLLVCVIGDRGTHPGGLYKLDLNTTTLTAVVFDPDMPVLSPSDIAIETGHPYRAYMVDYYTRNVMELLTEDNFDSVTVAKTWTSLVGDGTLTAQSITFDENHNFWVLVNKPYTIGLDDFLTWNCGGKTYLESINWVIPSPSPSPSPSFSPSPTPVPSPSPSVQPSVSPSPSPSPSPSASFSPSPSPSVSPSPVPSPSPSPSSVPSPSPTPVEEPNAIYCDNDPSVPDCSLLGNWYGHDVVEDTPIGDPDSIGTMDVYRKLTFWDRPTLHPVEYNGTVVIQLRAVSYGRQCVVTSATGGWEEFAMDDMYCYLRIDVQEMCKVMSGDATLCDYVRESDYCGSFMYKSYPIAWHNGAIDETSDGDPDSSGQNVCDDFAWGSPEDSIFYSRKSSAGALSLGLFAAFAALLALLF